MISTEDIARHDLCERFGTWRREFELPRIPLAEVLNASLRAGLLAGDERSAHSYFLEKAASPGLDIEGRNIYDIAVHHARMIEVICGYLLNGAGAWKPMGAVQCGFDYQPMSFLMDDGRLRRVVLCSSWNPLREAEERNSWWTVGDTAATGRPMLLNVIVIGSSRGGFRPSPWTTMYTHPENGIARIKKKEGKFSDGWKCSYRENSDHSVSDWLRMMQQDDAFEGIVHSFTVDATGASVLQDMGRIDAEIEKKGTAMRRSSCYRYVPCPMADLCPTGRTPENEGWKRKHAMIA